jgi:hypothetical protein
MKKQFEMVEIDGKMVKVTKISKLAERKWLHQREDERANRFWDKIEELSKAKETK